MSAIVRMVGLLSAAHHRALVAACLALLLLHTAPAWAAVAIDTACTPSPCDIQSASASNVQTIATPSFTITTNTNRAGVIGTFLASNTTTFTGTIGGATISAITGATATNATFGIFSKLFGAVNPASGSGQTAVLNWSGVSDVVVGVVVANGVNQGGVNAGTFNDGTGAQADTGSPSVTVTSNSGDLTVDNVSFGDGAITNATLSSPSQTQRWNVNVEAYDGGGGSTGGGTGNTTHSWALSTTGTPSWASAGANFVQTGGGGATCPMTLMLMGVGC